ncbi:MAG: hypothetical protein GY715_14240 [Planctomycetes bacterium]|nr:hypothetical protein [Planctomycetota bacterium]
MAEVNTEVRRIVHVTDLVQADVTGLETADFSFTLQVENGDALDAAPESVTVVEIGNGLYWLEFTPLTAGRVYRLSVAPVDGNNTADPDEFQIQVSGYAASTGPYLTTREAVRRALDLKDSDGDYTGTHDADTIIDDLLASVTAWAEDYTGREFSSETLTMLTEALGNQSCALLLERFPLTSITSVHVNTDLPRVFDADALLTDGTDFIVDLERGIVHRVDGSYWPRSPQSVKVIYTAGYGAIPAHVERAAIEIIATKYSKGKGQLYHVTGESRGDGSVTGIRFDDIPMHAREVFNMIKAK